MSTYNNGTKVKGRRKAPVIVTTSSKLINIKLYSDGENHIEWNYLLKSVWEDCYEILEENTEVEEQD